MGSKTTEEYKAELFTINPNLELLTDYKNTRTKVKIKDIRCGHEWDVRPTSLLKGHGCPICSGRVSKSHEQFLEDLSKVNKNIKILSKYKNSQTKVDCECLKCGYKYQAKPNSLLNGNQCGKCYGFCFSTEDFNEKLHKIHPNITAISDYVNNTTSVTFYCSIDKTTWDAMPHTVMRTKSGCPTCASRKQSERQTWTTEKYINELSFVTDKIIPLEDYISISTHIKHKCKSCDFEWLATPDSILKHAHCPKCEGTVGETKIANYLDKNNIKYECQKKFDGLKYKNPLIYDFYIPERNMLIEYDGEFHYFPIFSLQNFETEQIRDEIKNKFALENNISLIRIPYWDFDNIEKILDKILFYKEDKINGY